MELNIGRVMNLAHRAGLPKVEKAYPSMALGTAEATPLQVAAGYTMFANLGERVAPSAISRVTDGNGKTVVAPAPEKKRIVQADVAYIMNDIMKDVINRGTAAKPKRGVLKTSPAKLLSRAKPELRATAGSPGSRRKSSASFTSALTTTTTSE
jgi:membrane peptidoglycan carboxypeptidase